MIRAQQDNFRRGFMTFIRYRGSTLYNPDNLYPRQDCGRNTFLVLYYPDDDSRCVTQRVWSNACIRAWVIRYALRDAGYPDVETLAAVTLSGIEVKGASGYWDEVIHDLEYGIIKCPSP